MGSKMADSLCHLQLVVDRLLSGDLQQLSEGNEAVSLNLPAVSLDHEAKRLVQLRSQLESEYKSGVTRRLDELENLQRSLANLFWHAQQQIDAYGAADGSRKKMKLTDIVVKLNNIKDWVEKMEDLMQEEQTKILASESTNSDLLNHEDNSSSNA